MNDASKKRVLVVEDEYLIRMLLEDMLSDLGYEIAAAAGNLNEALDVAQNASFDAAILDVNLDGQEVFPVAEVLTKRQLPFVFVTGYGGRGLPDAYKDRPALQKPFQLDDLEKTLARIVSPAH